MSFEVAHDSAAQQVQHVRNGDECGGAFALHGADNFGGVCGRLKNDSGTEQWRHEQGHKLAKDVAKRNERGKTEWVKPTLVFAVGVNPALKRLEIGEEVSVGEDDATRLGSGAGSEENLRDVVAGDGFVGKRLIGRRRRSTRIESRRCDRMGMTGRVG